QKPNTTTNQSVIITNRPVVAVKWPPNHYQSQRENGFQKPNTTTNQSVIITNLPVVAVKWPPNRLVCSL
ncbi:MAG: hypothetical protein DRR08_14770, partial [Candidatus Parabeggiatoa sp. nov. 2]